MRIFLIGFVVCNLLILLVFGQKKVKEVQYTRSNTEIELLEKQLAGVKNGDVIVVMRVESVDLKDRYVYPVVSLDARSYPDESRYVITASTNVPNVFNDMRISAFSSLYEAGYNVHVVPKEKVEAYFRQGEKNLSHMM